MNDTKAIHSSTAPQAIGAYSHAVQSGNTVYLSGQIPLVPGTMELREGGIRAQAEQVFDNLQAVAEAAGGSLQNAVKINISLTDLADFSVVNEVMEHYFTPPYPARACVGVAALPRGAAIEIEAILAL